MGSKRKTLKNDAARRSVSETSDALPRAETTEPDAGHKRDRPMRLKLLIIFILVGFGVGAGYIYQQYRVSRLARLVRNSFALRRYDQAQDPLRRWLQIQPGSAEAFYYKAWNALAKNDPREAVEAVDRARNLGFDADRLDCFAAIYHARADRFGQAELVLERAFRHQVEPQEMVAKELARIYLSSYRLDQAARAIERWRALAPEDPEPCLWSNEIALRTSTETSVLIQNFRAALDRDPNLDQARLGLAQQLSKDRRFEEADREFLKYLEHKSKDGAAFLGLGRNSFQQGDIEKAGEYFEKALNLNPRDPEALKELGQIDLRLGRVQKACERLKLLTQIEPYDHEVRYSYAQSLKMAGDPILSRKELEVAARLRGEHEHIVQLRYVVLKNPRDIGARFQVAKWMMEHGHEDEGLKWTREILRTNPQHAATNRLLADYYGTHGEPGLANYHRLSAQGGEADAADPRNPG
jgi:tetratricopeptide (TPR) repeat protein